MYKHIVVETRYIYELWVLQKFQTIKRGRVEYFPKFHEEFWPKQGGCNGGESIVCNFMAGPAAAAAAVQRLVYTSDQSPIGHARGVAVESSRYRQMSVEWLDVKQCFG